MKKIKNITFALALIFSVTSLVSCDNGYDCDLNNTSHNNISFYTAADGKEEPYAHPEPLTISLMINGKDSVIINHKTDAEQISLPMSYTQGTDTIVIHYENNLCDSLYVNHTGKPYYQSMECGILMFHEIESIRSTNVWIEKASLMNNTVNFKGHENIRIYLYK